MRKRASEAARRRCLATQIALVLLALYNRPSVFSNSKKLDGYLVSFGEPKLNPSYSPNFSICGKFGGISLLVLRGMFLITTRKFEAFGLTRKGPIVSCEVT